MTEHEPTEKALFAKEADLFEDMFNTGHDIGPYVAFLLSQADLYGNGDAKHPVDEAEREPRTRQALADITAGLSPTGKEAFLGAADIQLSTVADSEPGDNWLKTVPKDRREKLSRYLFSEQLTDDESKTFVPFTEAKPKARKDIFEMSLDEMSDQEFVDYLAERRSTIVQDMFVNRNKITEQMSENKPSDEDKFYRAIDFRATGAEVDRYRQLAKARDRIRQNIHGPNRPLALNAFTSTVANTIMAELTHKRRDMTIDEQFERAKAIKRDFSNNPDDAQLLDEIIDYYVLAAARKELWDQADLTRNLDFARQRASEIVAQFASDKKVSARMQQLLYAAVDNSRYS